jgi:hypothetical protein
MYNCSYGISMEVFCFDFRSFSVGDWSVFVLAVKDVLCIGGLQVVVPYVSCVFLISQI